MNKNETTLLVTDSGLGGLSVFADIAGQLEKTAPFERVNLIYFNAWPFPDKGYNHFPDMAAKAAVFNNAMEAMAKYRPDAILIACNTLSVIYPFTAFSQATNIPVTGIVDHGITLIHEHLKQAPDSRVVIFGTPTTIEENIHKTGLIKLGVAPERIVNQGCVNLAGRIERNPFGSDVSQMIEINTRQAASKIGPFSGPLFAALCCTHFGYCGDLFSAALARHTRQGVEILNPNTRMAQINRLAPLAHMENTAARFPSPRIDMKIVSRVLWDKARITAYEQMFKEVSPQTIEALKGYTWDKELFQTD